jgi:hypothetical protein
VKDRRGIAGFWDRATWLIGSVLVWPLSGALERWKGLAIHASRSRLSGVVGAQGLMRAVNAVSVARLVLRGEYCLRSFGGSKDDGRLRWMALTRVVRGLILWGRRLSRAFVCEVFGP